MYCCGRYCCIVEPKARRYFDDEDQLEDEEDEKEEEEEEEEEIIEKSPSLDPQILKRRKLIEDCKVVTLLIFLY